MLIMRSVCQVVDIMLHTFPSFLMPIESHPCGRRQLYRMHAVTQSAASEALPLEEASADVVLLRTDT